MFVKSIRQTRLSIAIVVLATGILAKGQAGDTPLKLTATAVSLGDMTLRAGVGTLNISIDRWSTTAERELLMRTLLEKGAEPLLDTLRGMKSTGSIRTPTSLAYDLRFSYRMPADEGGDRIVLMTDRYIGFWEAANRPRTIDYPFTLIELRLNRDGQGEGKMSIATRIIPDKRNNVAVLENYSTQPVMLNNVRRVATGR